jgi:general secretion pathway protein K
LAAEWPDKPLLDRTAAFTLSTGAVHAQINDEGGRIDIGKAPAEFLTALLLSVGAPQPQADSIVRSVVKWRSHADAQSANSGPPSVSATGADGSGNDASEGFFTDVGQIAQIPGMRREWVAAIRPLTTVFGAETVNPLTAPANVIACLPGVDKARLSTFLAARRAAPNDANRLGTLLGPGQRYVMARPQQVAFVELAATLADGYAAAARAVIVLLPQDQQPYRTLVWTPLSLSAVH